MKVYLNTIFICTTNQDIGIWLMYWLFIDTVFGDRLEGLLFSSIGSLSYALFFWKYSFFFNNIRWSLRFLSALKFRYWSLSSFLRSWLWFGFFGLEVVFIQNPSVERTWEEIRKTSVGGGCLKMVEKWLQFS